MRNPRRIKAIAGNRVSCLGFSIALSAASIPAASIEKSVPREVAGGEGRCEAAGRWRDDVPACVASGSYGLIAFCSAR